jgi:hypothetical protein
MVVLHPIIGKGLQNLGICSALIAYEPWGISEADPEIQVRGRETVSEAGGLGPPWGPQWVQGKALLGAKPPEATEF